MPFRHTWSTLGNIDQFRWLSRADTLRHLAMARDEIGVRHVRAAAMFSPEMRVWEYALPDWAKPAAKKVRKVNWQFIDISIENLLELGLKPIYTTCFVPKEFTDVPGSCWRDGNAVGMPRDLNRWGAFVAACVGHHQRRYGSEELRSWYFECWNEPNLPNFFAGSQQDFFRLWSATWRAIKSVDPELRMGGPSTARGEWVSEFLDWTREDGTPPDYLITHIYNNDSESEPLSPFDGPASSRVKDSPNFASSVIRGLRKELDARGWKGEVHWNEWGRSWFPCDPAKETALEAAFIVRTMAQVSQEADHFGFWCLSDIYDQVGLQSSEFQGNYGLLSLHGLRKPGWFAHVLLNRLGNHRVPLLETGEFLEALATRDACKGCLLISAYPDSPHTEPDATSVRVMLPGTASAVRVTKLGAEENNIIARWKKMGAPEYPTPAELELLRSANSLQLAEAPPLNQRDGEIEITVDLERPGVACIEFDLAE